VELLNATKMKAGYTMGLKPDGRELLVVVVKGTFTIPKPGEEPQLAPQQAELVMADEFTGEPAVSAMKYESDFPPFKPRCDVLLNGSAYAPGGYPTARVDVGLRVGAMAKTFSVVGNRTWKKSILSLSATDPEPFVKMPISYDNAYGGVDKTYEDERKHRAFIDNPAGKGFHHNTAREIIEGKPLPNTEELDHTVTSSEGRYRPMAFGPIGRAWAPRPKYAGTYDQAWIDNTFPFLPADFDERYFQSAPEDQQIDHPRGGEEVVLLNLTPAGRTSFKLPAIDVPVTFYYKNHEEKPTRAALDTVIIEPDLNRFMLVWRTHVPLKKNMFEMAQVVAGTMPRAWHRARMLGKTWYPSLKELVDERAEARADAAGDDEEDAGTQGRGDAEMAAP
jgi:hypothetical protein